MKEEPLPLLCLSLLCCYAKYPQNFRHYSTVYNYVISTYRRSVSPYELASFKSVLQLIVAIFSVARPNEIVSKLQWDFLSLSVSNMKYYTTI